MSIDRWGTAVTFPLGLAFAIAACVALLKRRRHTAFNLGITAYILLWPVYLWFLQFDLTKRSGLSFWYIFNLIIIQIVLTGIAPLIVLCFYPFRPVLTTVQLLYIFSLVLQFFSYAYWSYGTTSNFSIDLTHLDSLYFALGTLTTAGTGNISAISETARGFQTAQMLIDFVLISLVVALIIARYSSLFSRPQKSGGDQHATERSSSANDRPKPTSQPDVTRGQDGNDAAPRDLKS